MSALLPPPGPTDQPPKPYFAWCWSHGRMHTFWPDRTAWCTATWTVVDGATEEDAFEAKVKRFGDAQFIHHLPLDQQEEIIRAEVRRG